MTELRFVLGTLELRGLSRNQIELPEGVSWDPRSECYRAEARMYADLLRVLVRSGTPYEDHARAYTELTSGVVVAREPRPYQGEALTAWERARSAGIVVLPTGAGKSQLGVMAIDKKRRSTLVVAPTLDLVRQWYDLLRTSFGTEVGIVGGGEHSVLPLTVTTYDSAYL